MSELTPEEIERIRKERALMEDDHDMDALLREEERIKAGTKAELRAAAKASGESAKRLWGFMKTKGAAVSQNVHARVDEFKEKRATRNAPVGNSKPETVVEPAEPVTETDHLPELGGHRVGYDMTSRDSMSVSLVTADLVDTPEGSQAIQEPPYDPITVEVTEPASSSMHGNQESPEEQIEPALTMDYSAYGDYLDGREVDVHEGAVIPSKDTEGRVDGFTDQHISVEPEKPVVDVRKDSPDGSPELRRVVIGVVAVLVVVIIGWGGWLMYESRGEQVVESLVMTAEQEEGDVGEQMGDAIGALSESDTPPSIHEPVSQEQETREKEEVADVEQPQPKTKTKSVESTPKQSPKPKAEKQKSDWHDDADKQLDELERRLG